MLVTHFIAQDILYVSIVLSFGGSVFLSLDTLIGNVAAVRSQPVSGVTVAEEGFETSSQQETSADAIIAAATGAATPTTDTTPSSGENV